MPRSGTASARLHVLMPSGYTGRFEDCLGNPDWFRNGTSLAPHPSPMPAMIAMADDLRMIENIVANGQAGRIIDDIIASPNPPFSTRWLATLSLAPTVGEAVMPLIGAIQSRNPYVRLELSCEAGRAAITLSSPVSGQGRLLIGITTLAFIHRAIDLLTGAPQDCLVECEMDRVDDIDAAFRGRKLNILWNADACRLSFPRNWLDLANRESDPVLWAMARERFPTLDPRGSQLPNAVSAHVGASLAIRKTIPSLAEAAASVGLSERTLVRRLGESGESFTRLVEQERRKLALLLLRNPDLPLQEIAESLGYPDSGRFGRAFRKWFDDSPARYRRIRLAPPRTVA